MKKIFFLIAVISVVSWAQQSSLVRRAELTSMTDTINAINDKLVDISDTLNNISANNRALAKEATLSEALDTLQNISSSIRETSQKTTAYTKGTFSVTTSAQQMSTVTAKKVIIYNITEGATIYIGSTSSVSSSNAVPIEYGKAAVFEVDNLNDLFIVGSTSNTVIYEVFN
jgi:FKBP-type peptidyl-prolyl cis-trans isomerase